MSNSDRRTWLITGASRGLGRAFTEAALRHGERVVATVRDTHALDELASSWGAQLVRRPLDVVVNNAGYALVGAIEEISEAQARAQLDTNLFGALWVTQAVLPHLRAQGSGRIVQISTVGAVGALPLFGIYNASKWALEGFSAALAEEVSPLGIGVHILQLGGFATDWAGRSMRFAAEVPAYDELRRGIFESVGYPDLSEVDPAEYEAPEGGFDAPPSVAAEALLRLVDSPDPPLRSVAVSY